MKKLKNILLWSLPVVLPILSIVGYEIYIFNTPPGILSEKKEDGSYETIAPFELTSQKNETFSSEKLNGHYYLVNFFFISCPDICPEMNSKMEDFYNRFGDLDNFRMVSFTVNPEQDKPEDLAAYASSKDAQYPDWVFLTGDRGTIYSLARNSFRVSAAETDGGSDGFLHSELLILVDDKGRLRGFYESTERDEMLRLENHLEMLLLNEKEQQS